MQQFTTRQMAFSKTGKSNRFRCKPNPVAKYLETTGQLRALNSRYDISADFHRKADLGAAIVEMERKARFWYNLISLAEMPLVMAGLNAMRNSGRG